MISLADTGPPPRAPQRYNLAADVLSSATTTPDKTALVLAGASASETWSYSRLARRALGLAAHLAGLGLPPRARILLRLGNTPHFPLAYLAATAADFVPVIVSSQWTLPEIAEAIDLTTPSAIVADPALPLPPTRRLLLHTNAIDPAAEARPLTPVQGDPERAAHIVFTSGTTGRARAVVHAHRALFARRMMWENWYGLTPADRVFHAGAFNWTYTLGTGLLDPWAAGATALIPHPDTPPGAIPDILMRDRATIFAAAPGVYRRVLATGRLGRLPALRHGLSAGEKLPPDIRARWQEATGAEVHEAFGMSECSTFLSGAPARPAPDGTLGFAQAGRRIALVDDAGTPVPLGQSGRIAVDAGDPGLMLGYLQDGAPALPLSQGWFVTGDLARMESNGAIRYLGRADDMMNAGGHRVSPLEVEQALATHSAVIECAAAEVTVKADTTVIAAFVVSPAPLDENALAAHMAGRLARYKCPRLYIRVDALPRNANGKLLRRTLARAHEEHHDPA